MLNAFRQRWKLGTPIVRDVREASVPDLFRGVPDLLSEKCPPGCHECSAACPTNAITLDPLRIDLGKCVFCPLCMEACPADAIRFTPEYRLCATTMGQLAADGPATPRKPELAALAIRRMFGRSLRLRSVSAGGCNGCELELNALSNVNFDMARFGFEFVSSPRHADGIVISGPIPAAMAGPLFATFDAVPSPKIVIAFGACAISGGVFQNSPELDRRFLEAFKIDLYVPGCPPHPLTFLTGLMDWLGR